MASGAGMRRLYQQSGAYVVEGGPTLNPSTFEILAGIHEVAAPEVVVLPNSGNVVLAAERAAELSEKEVAVVDSRWPQAGLACLIEHDPDGGLEQNAHRLRDALSDIATGAVAPAARDDNQGRFSQGDAVGFVDEQLVVWGDPRETLAGVFERLAQDREILTCICGADAPLDPPAVAALGPTGVELELHDGDQPHYWWLIAARSKTARQHWRRASRPVILAPVRAQGRTSAAGTSAGSAPGADNPSRAALCDLALESPHACRTTSGSLAVNSRAGGWSRTSTFLVTDDPGTAPCQAISRAAALRLAALQDAHLAESDAIRLDRTVGADDPCRLGTTLIMERRTRTSRRSGNASPVPRPNPALASSARRACAWTATRTGA